MKKIYIALALVAALSAGASWAGNMSVGKTTLSGDKLVLDNAPGDGGKPIETVKASGHANLISIAPAGQLKPGAMRLDSLKADDIEIVMTRGNKGRMSTKRASATGGVVIKAKRMDEEDGPNGKKVMVLRDVSAVAKSAELPDGVNSLVLTGDVTVKVTDPGNPEPLVHVSGDKVTVDLQTSRITVEGQPGSPAALILSPKEGNKK